LLRELDRHEAVLVADFRRFYGVRLRDEVHSADWDELLNLVLWLPPESGYAISKQAKDEQEARSFLGWSSTDDLLWRLDQRLTVLTNVLISANSEKRNPEHLEVLQHPLDHSEKPEKGKKESAGGMARAMIAEFKKQRGQ